MPEIVDVTELPALKGRDLGSSRWWEVTQEQISTFAQLTGDEQWIHVDTERARTGPFGTTIAHGFFILSRSTGLLYELRPQCRPLGKMSAETLCAAIRGQRQSSSTGVGRRSL